MFLKVQLLLELLPSVLVVSHVLSITTAPHNLTLAETLRCAAQASSRSMTSGCQHAAAYKLPLPPAACWLQAAAAAAAVRG